MRIAMALLALALATTGCKKKENPPAETAGSGAEMAGSDTGSDTGSAAGSDTGSAAGSAEAAADATLTKRAGNCPSTVLGATTKAEVKGKDVVVSITSTDKNAVSSIQQRAEVLLKERLDDANKQADPNAAHDRRGTHQGRVGLCPVHIPEGATAKAKNENDGVTITITPKDNVDALKSEIDTRIAKADAWVKENIPAGDKGNQGGVGGGKGEHGGTHSGEGDGKGVERKAAGEGGGGGGGADTGGGGGKGTGGGGSKGTGGGKAK